MVQPGDLVPGGPGMMRDYNRSQEEIDKEIEEDQKKMEEFGAALRYLQHAVPHKDYYMNPCNAGDGSKTFERYFDERRKNVERLQRMEEYIRNKEKQDALEKRDEVFEDTALQ